MKIASTYFRVKTGSKKLTLRQIKEIKSAHNEPVQLTYFGFDSYLDPCLQPGGWKVTT
jgi:hypothetical protein